MKKVIVADDSEEVAEVFRRTLVRRGYDVSVVANGDELLKSFRHTRSDGVIVDIEMPVKDGLEAIRELRAESASVAIVAISGSGSKSSLALERGADTFIPKPAAAARAVFCLEKLLGGGP